MPLWQPTVLTPKSFHRIVLITGGIAANIFQAITGLAADAIENGLERMTDDAIESWHPLVQRKPKTDARVNVIVPLRETKLSDQSGFERFST
jgi:hypothetical protein